MIQQRNLVAVSTIGFLVLLGSVSATFGACAPTAVTSDASFEAGPPCNPQGQDPQAGCSCNPSTYKVSDCYTGPPGTSGKGICQIGKRLCNPDGTLTGCIGEITPQPETCNLADDNCDGIVDDLPEIAEAGVLARCNSPACDPSYTDAAITCWGPDNGICGAGVKSCAGGPKGGTPNGCTEFIHAGVPEVCNGLDDDCNGSIDDGLDQEGPCDMDDGSTWPPDANPFEGGKPTQILGECVHGNLTCLNSNCTDHACADAGDQCFPKQPTSESCNGKDDDCNGKIDDHACAGNIYSEFYCCVYLPYPTDVFCDSVDESIYDPTYYSCTYAK